MPDAVNEPFRFLTTEEFRALSQEEKSAYLARAIEELKKVTDTLERKRDRE